MRQGSETNNIYSQLNFWHLPILALKINLSCPGSCLKLLKWPNLGHDKYFHKVYYVQSIKISLIQHLKEEDASLKWLQMAVIGAKGNFAGPGASFDDTDDKEHEIVCSQVIVVINE